MEEQRKKILLADSGGTSTSWGIIENPESQFFTSGSLHPDNITSKTTIPMKLLDYRLFVSDVYFYGSGCAKPERAHVLESLLSAWFPHAKIKVFSDLLAIAHAYWRTQPGLIGILGTGASMAWFNGAEIAFRVISKGKNVDPGSGTRIAFQMKEIFMNGRLPESLYLRLKKYLNCEGVVTNDRYVRFVFENLHEEFIIEFVKTEFRNYFHYYTATWQNKPRQIVFVGTVAWFGAKILKQIAEEFDLEVVRVVREPIYDLVNAYISSSNSSRI